MSKIKHAYLNLLEHGTVTLLTGEAASGFPLYRVHDRDIGKLFKATTTSNVTVKLGAAPITMVDRLIIPPGHNLNSVTVTVAYSDDDVTYHNAASQVVLPGLVDLPFAAPVAALFWRIMLPSSGAPVEIPELFLTSTYEHPRNPARPSGPHDLTPTMEVVQLAGGQIRTVRLGEPRRRRVYRLEGVSAAHKVALEELEAAWADGKPFWICDHEGSWIYVQLTASIHLTEQAYGRHSGVLECLEVLP